VNPDTDSTTICVEECGGACCAGGAFLRPADTDRLAELGHEDVVAADAPRTRTDADGNCVLLDDDGRCRVYEERPLDCRLFPLGFELDDEAQLVHIVLVGCPLAEQYGAAERDRLAADARRTLEQFDATTLRAYNELPFSGPHEQLTTIPYDTIPHDL